MHRVKRILLEVVIVGALGLMLAFAANALSPRGLKLARNYYPASSVGGEDSPTNQAGIVAVTNPVARPTFHSAALPETVRQRLAQHRLQGITSADALALFRDPRCKEGGVVFVDARDDVSYQMGHVPDAWQFNHYRAEDYLEAVLRACAGAEQVVVYCTGGDCEDSEFAAVMLRDAGVPAEKLLVYVGGITEWMAAKYPVESGGRTSGQISNPLP